MAKQKNIQYLNFPVTLLEDFMSDFDGVMNIIFNYSIYERNLKYSHLQEDVRVKKIAKELNYKDVNFIKDNLNTSKDLYNYFKDNNARTGLKVSLFWEYLKEDKTDFEKICLLGFLAFKSIIGDKLYTKTNNALWLSRMAGSEKTLKDLNALPDKIKQFNTRRKLDKIKTELRENWSFEHYGYYSRGYYISFKVTLEKLIYEVEKNKNKNKAKQRVKEVKNVRDEVLKKLENDTDK